MTGRHVWMMLLAIVAIVPAVVSAQGHLRDAGNPGSWTFELHEGAAGTLTRDGDALKVEVATPGREDWHVQLYQPGLNLRDGAQYTLRFRARSDAPREYGVYGSLDVPDYRPVFEQRTFRTTTAWAPVEVRFTARDVQPDHVRAPVFALGRARGTLWLSDVTLDGPRPPEVKAVVPQGWFEFAIPWDDTTAGVATDVSFLNHKPADRRVVTRGPHFVDEQSGERVRFWATNLGADEAFPDKADADLIAKRLAKAGVNLVRLHHLDNPWAIGRGSIWDRAKQTRQDLDAEMLDRLDYLIAQLKAHGIYVNLNLKVSKELGPADGIPASVKDLKFVHQKRVDYFVRRMIDLQKDYARKLLTHVNAYTKQPYTADPAVAFVEINNENALLGYWTRTLGAGLDTLPPEFRQELAGLWNAWLKRKYKSDDELKAAWGRGATPVGPNVLRPNHPWTYESQGGSEATVTPRAGGEAEVDVGKVSGTAWHVQAHLTGITLREGDTYTLAFQARADQNRPVSLNVTKDIADWNNMGLSASVDVTPQYQRHAFTFKAVGTTPGHARVAFVVGNVPGKIWIKDVELHPGARDAGLRAGESVAKGNVGIPGTTTKAQQDDWIQFLIDTERAYADEMLDFLQKDLGVRASVALTQIDYGGIGGLVRERRMHFTDTHAYWQHPSFPGASWDPANWTIENTPQIAAMSDTAFGVLGGLAMCRVAGKPFTVSEYDHPAPSDYAVEMIPQVAAFAAVQDWDAIYTFAVADYTAQTKPDRVLGFFDQLNHPAKLAFYPTAALVLRRGLIAPAPGTALLELPAPVQSTAHMFDDAWRTVLGPDAAPGFLMRRLTVAADPIAGGEPPRVTLGGAAVAPQVQVRKTDAGNAMVIAAPAVAGAVGFVGGTTTDAGPMTVAVKPFGNNFAAATAVATDGKPIAESGKVLVTICGRVENKAMGWNAARTSVGTRWGQGPTIAEHVPATVALTVPAGRKVYALDGNGSRKGEVPAKADAGRLTFDVRPQDATLWYEVGM